MTGSTVNTNKSSAQVVNKSGQVKSSGGLQKLEKPTISTNMLHIVKQHRINNVKAFVHARGGNKGVENTASVIKGVANDKMVDQYKALFGKDSSLLKMAADLYINRDKSQYLQNTENISKAKYLNLFARPLQEFKEALSLAESAPQVGENFDEHSNQLLIKSQKLNDIANIMPDTSEGKQMKALCISMAEVCADKSKRIAENQKVLDNLIVYDAAIDAVTQKMDALDAKMKEISKISEGYTEKLLLNTSLSESDIKNLENNKLSASKELVSIFEQHNQLAAQRHHLMEAQAQQEQKIAQLPPKLQEMADAKLALEDPFSAQQNLLQKQELLDELEQLEKLQVSESLGQDIAAPKIEEQKIVVENNSLASASESSNGADPENTMPVKTVAQSAQLHANDLILKSYSSALDLLNVNIANLYASGKKKEALTLIICREKLRASLNDQTEKANKDNQSNAVRNVLPGGQKKLGLISRMRVKFQAKAALSLGKNYKPLNQNLTKLDAKTTLAAYLQGAYKQAGLSGADVPSKAELREALQQGISNPRNVPDFGKLDPSVQQAAANANVSQQVTNPPEEQKVKPNALQEAFTAKAKQFDSSASSFYTKLTLKGSKTNQFLQKASVQDLFLARQQATKLYMDNATPNKDTHKFNRDLIDSAIKKRLIASELAVGNLHLDKDPVVLGNGRLISASEILEGLERKNHLKNLAGSSQVFADKNQLETAANVYLATNNGPAYGVLNENGHWVTIIATKNANGAVETYAADTKNLQADNNKGLPNACGPLQILMHEELTNRLVANPSADAIQTMKDIESDLQAMDEKMLKSVVLQQRMESLDNVIKNLPKEEPAKSAAAYAQSIDKMAEAFNF